MGMQKPVATASHRVTSGGVSRAQGGAAAGPGALALPLSVSTGGSAPVCSGAKERATSAARNSAEGSRFSGTTVPALGAELSLEFGPEVAPEAAC